LGGGGGGGGGRGGAGAVSTETFIAMYQATWCHIPQGTNRTSLLVSYQVSHFVLKFRSLCTENNNAIWNVTSLGPV
jgi:hypothetical protein